MNSFGTTRQDVGGEDKDKPKKPKWYDTVPFRPCRPPVPQWMLDWPFETRGGVGVLNVMTPGRSCGPNGYVLGDPGETTLAPPGPLEAPGGSQITATNSGQRTWGGRMRQAGSNLRSILYSPMYSGPALWTEALFFMNRANVTGDEDSFYFGVVAGTGTTQSKVNPATLPIPAGAIGLIDYSNMSDNEFPRTGLVSLSDMGSAVYPQHPNIYIPWTSFSMFAMLNTIGNNAAVLDWLFTFVPAQQGGGPSVNSVGGVNQYRAGTYLGGPA